MITLIIRECPKNVRADAQTARARVQSIRATIKMLRAFVLLPLSERESPIVFGATCREGTITFIFYDSIIEGAVDRKQKLSHHADVPMNLHTAISSETVRSAFRIALVILIGCTGCKMNDGFKECQMAEKHYELDDIPHDQIVEMFGHARKEGDVHATMWLARFYNKGRCDLPNDPDTAQEMARPVIGKIIKLANHGDPDAEFLLASAYQEGLGMGQNLDEAFKWYTKAADAGHLTAMVNLGVMYAHGQGVALDIEKARSLFNRASSLGSALAAKEVEQYADNGLEDRLESLRAVPLVQVLGKSKDDGILFLIEKGLISNPKDCEESDFGDLKQSFFKSDGIVLNIDANGRIVDVEGHAAGSRKANQFKGTLPFGISWNDTVESTKQILGEPYDFGNVPSDEAYGMAYLIRNVVFAIMFSNDGEKKVKLWRVYEKWPVDYASQNSPTN